MKLRDHPGVSTWPPTWLATSGSQDKKLLGDSGILIQAALSRIEPITICFLTAQFEGEPYIGSLVCKDASLCQALYNFLQKHIGKPIAELGDLDLPEND